MTEAETRELTEAVLYIEAHPPEARQSALHEVSLRLGRRIGAGELDRDHVIEVLFKQACLRYDLPHTVWEEIAAALEKGAATPLRRKEDPPLSLPEALSAPEPHQVSPSFPLTDSGNAERLVYRHGERLRYCHDMKQWFVWDGTRWAPDATDEVGRLALETVRSIYGEAEAEVDDKARKALGSWALRSEAGQKRREMVNLARSDKKVAITSDRFDLSPWLLNCLNGTVDLRTGVLYPHRRGDLISKLLPVYYDPSARSELWEKTISEAMGGNPALISYLQRLLGYCLTGDTREECLGVAYGKGRNGKGTIFETALKVLGDYGQSAEFSTFITRKNQGVRNDIAALKGARYVLASENEKGERLAESLIKRLTGGDTVRSRFLFKEGFDYIPQFKIIMLCNYKPEIRGTDEGIWSRIRLIPFTQYYPEEKRDLGLKEKLRSPQEAPGILAWMVRGCLAWQKEGLNEPEEIRRATADYREEMDALGEFLSTRCVLDPNVRTPATPLYKDYLDYCSKAGEEPLTATMFGRSLKARGLQNRTIKGLRVWFGVGLKTEEHGVEGRGLERVWQQVPPETSSRG